MCRPSLYSPTLPPHVMIVPPRPPIRRYHITAPEMYPRHTQRGETATAGPFQVCAVALTFGRPTSDPSSTSSCRTAPNPLTPCHPTPLLCHPASSTSESHAAAPPPHASPFLCPRAITWGSTPAPAALPYPAASSCKGRRYSACRPQRRPWLSGRASLGQARLLQSVDQSGRRGAKQPEGREGGRMGW